MKLAKEDFPALKGALLLALGLMLCALLIGLAAQSGHDAAQGQHRAAMTAWRDAQRRLGEAHGEEKAIHAQAARFDALRAKGAVGPEKRLEWTEQLAGLGQTLGLPGLRYEFSPQTPLEEGKPGDYIHYASAMKARLLLLHEGDLLRFLQRLRREAPALVIVRGCQISRLETPPDFANSLPGPLANPPDNPLSNPLPATLRADCDMDWITLRQRPAP